ncbi:hypothetical protein L596_029311 [Steinernema carpocapsae]|uniref:Uncharacterized protein n=1 Tax=Steinernema carpocapsae TaxID=34508 RepID=A0A4U5LU90_STECR|nr:hypothetical protein L596_029311 [Steinernema carpocapsae]
MPTPETQNIKNSRVMGSNAASAKLFCLKLRGFLSLILSVLQYGGVKIEIVSRCYVQALERRRIAEYTDTFYRKVMRHDCLQDHHDHWTHGLLLPNPLIAGILALAWNDVTWKCTNAVLEAMTFVDVGLAASQCVMCQVGEFFACMRAGYLEAVPFLFLVLALNRLAVMLEFKRKRIVDILCSVSS